MLCGCTQAGKTRKERNDCSVIALAVVTNFPYELCYQLLQTFGYEKERGVYWGPVIQDGPFDWRETLLKPISLKRFTVAYPRGRYLCILRHKDRKRCHALAVVNGIVLNAGVDSIYSRVACAWEYKGVDVQLLPVTDDEPSVFPAD